MKIPTKEKDVKRFWRRVEKGNGEHDCWNWSGYRGAKGHGIFVVDGKIIGAHRISFELANGEIPEGMIVAHSCGNPACVNPNHLFIDSHSRKGSVLDEYKHQQHHSKSISWEYRFFTFVDKTSSPNGCWLWTGGVGKHRYGSFKINRKYNAAHRVAYCIANNIDIGELPQDLYVLHSCDNPLCVNPDHLRLGTQIDNMMDMMIRGRKKTKLTSDQVREIRREFESGGITQLSLANKYDMNIASISDIVKYKQWKYV